MGIFHLKRGQKEAFFDPPHLVHVVFEQPLSLLATTKPIPETAHFLITQSKIVKIKVYKVKFATSEGILYHCKGT